MSSGSPSSHASKPGEAKQIIQRHREREPFLGRVERFQIQHSDSRHGRRLYRLDQSRQVEVATLFPRAS